MRLVTTKKAIAQAAAIASRMATGKIAASRCVRLEATADGLRIDASDGETAVRYDAAGEVRKPGVACVSAARFAAVVNAAGETLELSATKTKLEVRSGSSRWEIGLEDATPLGIDGKREAWPCKPSAIVGRIGRVLHAADNESSRYALAGVRLEQIGLDWRTIATDGRRLEVAGPIDAEIGVAMIVPSRLCKTLLSVFGGCDEGVIGYNDSTIAIAGGGWTVAGRLLEGRFPKWRDVIPSLPHQIDIDAHAIREVIARVQVCSGEATSIDIEIGDGTLTARGYDETSSAEAETAVETGAAPLKTTLAAEFLLQAIAESIGTIAIHYGTAEQPVVIYDADVTAVIMPMTGGGA